MRAIEEKANFSNELTTVEASAFQFKVVVNNYKKEKENQLEKMPKGDDLTTTKPVGLPPQPASYLKYPKYDWF